MFWLAELLERLFPATRRLRLVDVIQVFSASIKLELDLRMEASAGSELADNFSEDTDFKVPKVYWDYTSQRVLTIEKITGCRPDNRQELKRMNLDPRQLVKKSTRIFFNQVFTNLLILSV